MVSEAPASQGDLIPFQARQRAPEALRDVEPAVRDQFMTQLLNALSPILCKVSPGLMDDAAGRWRVAMAQALSDLPGQVAVEATQRALSAQLKVEPKRASDQPTYRPIQRVSEIETLIRQQADLIRRRDRPPTKFQRQQPRCAPDVQETSSQAEVDELNSIMRRFGIERRWRLGPGATLEPIMTEAELRQRSRIQRRSIEAADASNQRRIASVRN